MLNILKQLSIQLMKSFVFFLVSLLTGVHTKKDCDINTQKSKVFYANHNSHGDFLLIWVSLPKKIRLNSHPVAGKDYWLANRFRAFLIKNVFNGVLISRDGTEAPEKTIDTLSDYLKNHESLIIFPEGTRKTDEDLDLQFFKSGIYYLAKQNPDTEFIPVWIENIQHVLPKGKVLPVPVVCHVKFGEGIFIEENEEKELFLARTRDALLTISESQ